MLKEKVCKTCAEIYLGKMIWGFKWLDEEQKIDQLQRWLKKFDECYNHETDPFINCPTNVPYGITGFAYPDDDVAPEWCPFEKLHKE
jgi:hypothetical protein